MKTYLVIIILPVLLFLFGLISGLTSATIPGLMNTGGVYNFTK